MGSISVYKHNHSLLSLFRYAFHLTPFDSHSGRSGPTAVVDNTERLEVTKHRYTRQV